jgi:hypothetical protein
VLTNPERVEAGLHVQTSTEDAFSGGDKAKDDDDSNGRGMQTLSTTYTAAAHRTSFHKDHY